MKTVVITGGLGFIGSQVVFACLREGWRVYCIDKLTCVANKQLLSLQKNERFTFLEADIAELDNLPDCDYVINLAAESHVANSIVDSGPFLKSNVLGVQNLLELIRHKNSNISNRPVFFHFSTDEVYGDIESGSHTEESLLNPSNPYSASKAAADMLIKAWARTYNLEYIILRPTNNYGKYQYPEKLIPLGVKLLDRGLKIRLHDAGEPYRNWLHTEDTAAAVIAVIKSGIKNEIFNVSANFEQKNKVTIEKVIRCYYNNKHNWKDFVDFGYKRKGQDVRYSLDTSKIERMLGWKPIKVFDQEINKIVEHYKNHFRW